MLYYHLYIDNRIYDNTIFVESHNNSFDNRNVSSLRTVYHIFILISVNGNQRCFASEFQSSIQNQFGRRFFPSGATMSCEGKTYTFPLKILAVGSAVNWLRMIGFCADMLIAVI